MNWQEFEQKPAISQPELLSVVELKKLAKLYAEVFSAPPWNEVWRCSNCNRFYGAEYVKGKPSPCCSIPLVEAYPEDETANYILDELSQPLAKIELIDHQSEQLEAFAWGYLIPDVFVFAQKKWPQSEEIQNKVIQAITEYTRPELPFYYISEVGVSSSLRGNGLGLRLTQKLLKFGFENRLPVIFRTNWASPMMRIAQRLEMKQIMGPEVEIINNQIVKTGKIAGFVDEINPDRTLFIILPNLS
jgi:predicted GNAT family acetyltransferase